MMVVELVVGEEEEETEEEGMEEGEDGKRVGYGGGRAAVPALPAPVNDEEEEEATENKSEGGDDMEDERGMAKGGNG